jgi:hypothetical protein
MTFYALCVLSIYEFRELEHASERAFDSIVGREDA